VYSLVTAISIDTLAALVHTQSSNERPPTVPRWGFACKVREPCDSPGLVVMPIDGDAHPQKGEQQREDDSPDLHGCSGFLSAPHRPVPGIGRLAPNRLLGIGMAGDPPVITQGEGTCQKDPPQLRALRHHS
jgi:hypothetical protein